MKQCLVSVVMPVFNSARFIREALYSLEKQTYRNFEVIAVDGGSNDGTLEYLDDYSAGAPFAAMKIIRSKGKNLAHDLNLGLEQVAGDFIARMDADDMAFWERLDEQVAFFRLNPLVDLLGTGARKFGSGAGDAISPKSHRDIMNAYLVNNPFFHPTVMVRRHLVDHGLFRYDPDFLADEDYELWGRLLNAGVVCANIEKPLLAYRLHGANAQRHPSRYRFKHEALTRFCARRGLPHALVGPSTELQCSGFISPEGYGVFRDYALVVQAKAESHNTLEHMLALQGEDEQFFRAGELPMLGWLHDAIVKYEKYPDFLNWYWEVIGWSMHGTRP